MYFGNVKYFIALFAIIAIFAASSLAVYAESQLLGSKLEYNVSVKANGIEGCYSLSFIINSISGSYGSGGKFNFTYQVKWLSGVIPSEKQFSTGTKIQDVYEFVLMDKAYESYLSKKPVTGTEEVDLGQCIFYINTTNALKYMYSAPGFKIIKFINTSSGSIVVFGLKNKDFGQALVAFDNKTGVVMYFRVSTLDGSKEVELELTNAKLPSGAVLPSIKNFKSTLESVWSSLTNANITVITVTTPPPPSVVTTTFYITVTKKPSIQTVTITSTTTVTKTSISTTTTTKTLTVEKTNVKITVTSVVITAIVVAIATASIYRRPT